MEEKIYSINQIEFTDININKPYICLCSKQ